MCLHQGIAYAAQPPFKRLPWSHFPNTCCLMGGLTVTTLNCKWFIITYADDQTVANVGLCMQDWSWPSPQWGLLALVQGCPPSPHSGSATGQHHLPSSCCRVPAQRASLAWYQATPLPCQSWQWWAFVVVPAVLQFLQLRTKDAAVKSYAAPFPKEAKSRSHTT